MEEQSVRKNNSGLSLVELLVVVAILSIALTGILNMMVSVTKHYNKQSRNISLHDELQTTFNFVSDKIKAADKIEFNSASGELTIHKGEEGSEQIERIIKEDSTLYYYPADGSGREVLTQDVKEFSVGPDTIETYAVVKLTLKSATEQYDMEQNIFMRGA